MSDDPFKDLRSKLALSRQFPELALNTKEARAQAVLDRFTEAWHPMFDYLAAVSTQEDLCPKGKVLKAVAEYKEDSFSKYIYLRIAFCDQEEDMGIYVKPHLSFSCGLITDAQNDMSQKLYTDFDDTVLANVEPADRQQAIYHMLRVLIADNFEYSTEKLKFTPYDFEPMKVFLNKWLATQIATDLGAAQPKAGTLRQFKFG